MARATMTHQTTVKAETVAMTVIRMTTAIERTTAVMFGTTTAVTSEMITAGTTATIAVITTVAELI